MLTIKTHRTCTDVTVGDKMWRIGLNPSEASLRILSLEIEHPRKKWIMKRIRVHFVLQEQSILKYLKVLRIYLSI